MLLPEQFLLFHLSKMPMTHKRYFMLASLFILLLVSCKDGGVMSAQEQFGKNSWYFMALNSIQSGAEEDAIGYLKQGIKKSDDYFAKKCFEELSRFGSASDRVSTAQEMYKRFPDIDSLLRLVQELSNGKDFSQIVSLTANSKESFPPELTYHRLVALANEKKQGFAGEIEDWFIYEPITDYHQQYFDSYKETLLPSLLSKETIQCIKIRLSVYIRDYREAFSILAGVLQGQQNPSEWLVLQSQEMFSDIGKTFLYGTSNFIDIAQFMESSVKNVKEDTPDYVYFYLYFYAGRLYDKGLGTGNKKASDMFLAAMELAPTAANYDNALWYYLSLQLKISIAAAEDALKKYGSTIHDPWYYSDFFETMMLRYFTEGDWSGVLRCFSLIKNYADMETISRYAYLGGRLVQQELIDLDEFPLSFLEGVVGNKGKVPVQASERNKSAEASRGRESETDSSGNNSELPLRDAFVQTLFTIAYEAGGDLYYRLLAARQLDYSPSVVDQSLYQTKVLEDFTPDPNIETLLQGYMVFDLPEFIYETWRENSHVISLEMAQKISSFLSLSGVEVFAAQGLLLMSNAIFQPDTQTTEEMYRLAYPRLFSHEVAAAADEYELSEYLIYALIRSESFFDPDIESYAGAIGLAQLMPSTAGDIARKLKIKEYDLTDPQTNINFGCFYLAELIGRLDNSIIEALYSYNAGITNVRNWRRIFPDLPEDLILELIPFTETRNYGKKIISSAAVYGNLYYGKAHNEVVDEIMFSDDEG